jgi:hypothetical protein
MWICMYVSSYWRGSFYCNMHVCMCACGNVSMYVCIVEASITTGMDVYMYVDMYVCMYISSY